MPTTLDAAITRYLRSGNPAHRTREEYSTTLKKWKRWGNGVPIDELGRKVLREFLDWVYEDAVARQGGNPGRTANKVRSHLRAVMSWAWEQDIVDVLPQFEASLHEAADLLIPKLSSDEEDHLVSTALLQEQRSLVIVGCVMIRIRRCCTLA